METRYLLSAIRAAVLAGRKIMAVYTAPDADFQIEKKADNSPVTIADKQANALISAQLSAETPFPLLTEEGLHAPYETRKEWQEMWVVDPLDGTKEFISRNGDFTVNIAYVSDGTPEAGVIYVPVSQELYFADHATGAFRVHVEDEERFTEDLALASSGHDETNRIWQALTGCSEKLPVAKDLKHNGYIVVASRSFLNDETRDFIEHLKESHTALHTLSRGSSLKICAVAEGSADIYPRFAPTMEWDTAAGHAIIRAAGGDIYEPESNVPLTYNKEDLHNPWFVVRRNLQ